MTNTVEQMEQALDALRWAGEELRAQTPHSTSGVYRHDIVDEGDKLVENVPNPDRSGDGP
jgi:hypothetical protein